MKKIILAAFMAACGLQMSAQQNLFVAQDLESAIVNKDNTVTFNFKAPDAQKVQIAGDFAEKAEGQHIGGMVGAGLIDMIRIQKEFGPILPSRWIQNFIAMNSW